jgi:hypothetical protein
MQGRKAQNMSNQTPLGQVRGGGAVIGGEGGGYAPVSLPHLPFLVISCFLCKKWLFRVGNPLVTDCVIGVRHFSLELMSMLLRSKGLIRQPFRAYASNIASSNNSKSVLTPKYAPKYSSLISRGKATQAMHLPHLQEEKPFPSILIKGDGQLVSKVRCCCF